MTEKPFFQLTNCNDEKQKSPLPPDPRNAVTIAISPRTLFNMVAESGIYQNQGVEKYIDYQVEHENEIMGRGDSFPFVKALMTVNSRLRDLYPESEELFDIVLMTNSHAQVGVRIINSINHYNLTIERFCMTGGQSPIGYLKAYNTNLYLSKDPEKVTEAIKAEIAAATMYSPDYERELSDSQLRVAFDGDAVLFSDESEKVLKQEGLKNFFLHEKINQDIPLAQGPLKGFLEALGKLQKKFYAKDERNDCPIRTFLVTARSAASSGARVIKTLRSWGLEIDEALFAAGAPKGPLLRKIKPHIFFDDQMFNIQGAKKMGTISAHVPYGIGQIGQSQSYPQHPSQHPSQHASQQQSGQSYQQQQSGPTQSYQQQQSGPAQSYQPSQQSGQSYQQQSESRQTYQHYPTHLSQ